jgi:acetyl esterase/lipase
MKWPKTRILVGTKDPLYDDSLKLFERMILGKIDCKLIILEEFIHACLSLDFAIP